MIPDEKTIRALWITYHLPSDKQMHCDMVRKVALAITEQLEKHSKDPKNPYNINEQLLIAGALLHDIDKNIEKLPGEHHPDAAVRILKEKGMEKVAEIVRTHPLHMILDEEKGPKTIEQQILFLADKMTKNTFIGLEKRFQLWRHEDKDEISQHVLDTSYPKVMALYNNLLGQAGITEADIVKFVQ